MNPKTAGEYKRRFLTDDPAEYTARPAAEG